MVYKYRYLPKKYIVISFLLVFSSLLIMAAGAWFGVISHLSDGKPINGMTVFLTIGITFVATGPLIVLNEKLIKSKCGWDQVSVSEKEISSSRYGFLDIKDVKRIYVNDLSKVYTFSITTNDRRFKFTCLNFLGREGPTEYDCDKESLKSLAENLLQLANSPNYNITVGKESSSGILFVLSCVAMLLLIPEFIYAPGRMIFVAPFVIPLFFCFVEKTSI